MQKINTYTNVSFWKLDFSVRQNKAFRTWQRPKTKETLIPPPLVPDTAAWLDLFLLVRGTLSCSQQPGTASWCLLVNQDVKTPILLRRHLTQDAGSTSWDLDTESATDGRRFLGVGVLGCVWTLTHLLYGAQTPPTLHLSSPVLTQRDTPKGGGGGRRESSYQQTYLQKPCCTPGWGGGVEGGGVGREKQRENCD